MAEDTAMFKKSLDSVIAGSMKYNKSLHEDKFIYLRYKNLPFTSDYNTTSGYAFKPSGSARDLGVQMSADYTVHLTIISAIWSKQRC